MNPVPESLQRWRCPLGLALLLLLTGWIYWPGLAGPWLFDDYENLSPLEKIEDSPAFLMDVVRGNISGPTGRPVSMLGFALEKLYLKHGVRGQKSVNLLLHLGNGCLVFLFALQLCRRLVPDRAELAALYVTAFWLLAPLLLSTTLYVVQRMTLLAAGFSLLSLNAYCRARLAQGAATIIWWWLCFSAAVLAFLSKENGLLVLPMLLLLEVFLFRFAGRHGRWLVLLHAGIWGLGLLGLLLLLLLLPERVFDDYGSREFTLRERLLTEPRILWHYLGQLVWPRVQIMGLFHDDWIISRNVWQPLTTLPGLLGWLAVPVLVIYAGLKARLCLVGLGLGIFLVGHLMESTLFALDLYYEHRNYLPAVGLVLALLGLGIELGQRLPWLRQWIALAGLLLLSRNAILLGSQATIWSDERVLVMDAVNHHPHSPRANYQMGQIYARYGGLRQALQHAAIATALDGSSATRGALLRAQYHCFSGVPIAAGFWNELSPPAEVAGERDFSLQFKHLVQLLINEGCPGTDVAAQADAFRAMFTGPGEAMLTPQVLGALVLLEGYLQRYRVGLDYALALSAREPGNVMALQFRLFFATALEDDTARDAAVTALSDMRESGLLNAEESYNLELFLKN